MVSDGEKARDNVSGGGREGERKRITDDVSKVKTGIRTEVFSRSRDKFGGEPVYRPSGVRHIGDASPVCGFRAEQEKARPDTSPLVEVGERGRAPSGPYRKGLSTDAGRAGGPTRSSDEALVIGVERRGRVVRDEFMRSTKVFSGGVAWVS